VESSSLFSLSQELLFVLLCPGCLKLLVVQHTLVPTHTKGDFGVRKLQEFGGQACENQQARGPEHECIMEHYQCHGHCSTPVNTKSDDSQKKTMPIPMGTRNAKNYNSLFPPNLPLSAKQQ
jgi:hypothetical protein